jgi:hypothetical protein
MEHTPTPWFVDYYCRQTGSHTIGPNGFVDGIAQTRPSPLIKDGGLANAEFIALSVNAHDALVAACEKAQAALIEHGYLDCIWVPSLEAIAAALKAAKGK